MAETVSNAIRKPTDFHARCQMDELTDVFAARAFVLTHGGGSWLRPWAANPLLVNNLQLAQFYAEHKRKKGRVFEIAEVPCLVLVGRSINVVVVDFRPPNPFSAWAAAGSALRHGNQLGSVVHCLGPDGWNGVAPPQGSILFGEMDSPHFLPPLDRRPLIAQACGTKLGIQVHHRLGDHRQPIWSQRYICRRSSVS